MPIDIAVIPLVILYALLLIFVLSFGFRKTREVFSEDLGYHTATVVQRSRRRKVITALVALTVGLVVIDGSSWVITAWANRAHDFEDTEDSSTPITVPFGLTPEQSYPLVLGARVGTSQSDLHVEGGFFDSYVSLRTMSGSAVTVSFTHQNKTYMLEIPTVKTVFTQSATDSPSVVFYFQKHEVDSWYDDVYGLPNVQQDVTDHYSQCHLGFADFVLACVGSKLVSTKTKVLPLSSTELRHGLSPIVSKYIDSAAITLTPKMYAQLSGTIG